MARKKRMSQPGMCHHVMLRGIDGKAVFSDNRDRARFCLLLQEASELHSLRVHAFCLMTNHIHLILEPLQKPLTFGVHRFASRYAQHFNRRYRRKGYVFQGRFKSILVQDGVYLRRLTRYIHLNPLEAGLVKIPGDYQWSSHNAYFGLNELTWLETDRVLSHFGESRREALVNLAGFMSSKVGTDEDAEEIRRAARCGVYGGEEFTRIFAPDDMARQCTTENKLTVEQLVRRVCDKCGVSLEQLCSANKSRKIADARAVLARASQLLGGISLGDVSRFLRKNHGTVSRWAAKTIKPPHLKLILNELVKSP